ncbi:UDP-N-acetylglucosamine 2-epimerase [Dehalococcoidia bacterium]|nr:UDP-N-acetylglucosamine 2-epimerase [Dehalococcoidia bacterium]
MERSDYSIYLPVLRQISGDPELRLHLIVGGAHLSPEFGLTVRDIENDGFEISDRVEMLANGDSPEATAKSMGLGTIGFGQVYARSRPDLLLVLGDRFDMHAAVVAALPFNIPVAHIHGGESTLGAIDESLRHSITKMSHLHFAAAEEYAQRVIQMGEEPWRVTVSGAPGLDNLRSCKFLEGEDLRKKHGVDLKPPFLLATFHPSTLQHEKNEARMGEFLAALDGQENRVVLTYPNADAGSRAIINMAEEFASKRPHVQIAANLGTQGYFNAMKHAAAMVGNSSSGIIEAASFQLPVVDIGDRQEGRVRGKNVINVGHQRKEIQDGIQTALAPEFRNSLKGLANPYGDGHAAERIVTRLKAVELNEELLKKRFHRS